MWEAEHVGHPSDWGGVPSTVHILVYLLRHLLRMTEVRCGDGHSVDGGEGPGETTNTHYTVQSHVWIKIRINDRGSTQLTASWPQCCGPWWFAECSSHWKREQVPVNAYCGSTKNVFKDEEIPSQLGLTWCPYHIIHDNNVNYTETCRRIYFTATYSTHKHVWKQKQRRCQLCCEGLSSKIKKWLR